MDENVVLDTMSESGKKISSEDDKNLISKALSLIWIKTNKEVESCYFDKDKVRLTFKKDEKCVYFDLQESLSIENEVTK
jgi:hypothetical protein